MDIERENTVTDNRPGCVVLKNARRIRYSRLFSLGVKERVLRIPPIFVMETFTDGRLLGYQISE